MYSVEVSLRQWKSASTASLDRSSQTPLICRMVPSGRVYALFCSNEYDLPPASRTNVKFVKSGTMDKDGHEGSSVTFSINTKNVEWGSTISYLISGICTGDVSGGVSSGNAVVNFSGVATISVTLLNDNLTEGSEYG